MSDAARAHAEAGAAHIAAGNYLAAQASYEQALLLNVDAYIWHYGLGLALQKSKQYDAAISAYDKVIALYPTMAYAHFAKAQCALMVGDFAGGWPAYEWRIQFDEIPPNPFYKLSPPTWTLEAIKGKTVLLWHEQGFGDMIQFSRFLPLIAQSAAKVYWVVHPLLRRLFEQSFSLPNVVITSITNPMPEHDAHCSVMSLPLICGIDCLEKIPDHPYLFANPEQVASWQKKISVSANPGLRVGLVWAGGIRSDNPEAEAIDSQRSMPLATLSTLSAVKDIQFFSLQKDHPSRQIHSLSSDLWHGEPMIDWTSELHDWADSANFVSNLDLVITCCTAVAHLAAAMGKPTWILLDDSACWRWLQERSDSAWYPTVRLFRQSKTGDWDEVVDRVSAALKELL